MSKVLANGKKATKAEVEERVTAVFTLTVRGATRDEILRHAAKEWGLAPRTVDDYIARATDRLKALAVVVREEELGRARAQLHDLYGKNMRTQDYKGALQVRKDLSELLGLYAPRTTKIDASLATIPTEPAAVLSDAELAAAVETLLSSAATTKGEANGH